MPGLPRFHCSTCERFGPIRNRPVVIDSNDPSEPTAGSAGTDGMIETEHRRRWFAIFDIAVRAMEALRKPINERSLLPGKPINRQPVFSEMISFLTGLGEPRAILRGHLQTILNHDEILRFGCPEQWRLDGRVQQRELSAVSS